MVVGLLDSIADFDQLPIAAVVVDSTGKVVAINRAAQRLAWTPVVGEPVWQASAQLGSRWPSLMRRPQAVPASEPIDCEFSTDSGIAHYRISLRVLYCSGAAFTLFCLVDITDHVLSARDASTRRLESLGRVAGGLAHEFNNQLVSVVSEANMLGEDKTLSDDLRDAVGRIDSAANRMAGVTKQLLAFSGRGRFVATVMDPSALVNEARQRIDQIVPSTIAVSIEFDRSAAGVAISADRNTLQQVLLDLVANAVDACGESGTIRIISRAASSSWELEVQDDGAGIDTLVLNRIFEPFFSTKTNHRGLGLSAALGIVKSLGGDIAVTSRPQHGTAFVVRIPIVHAAARPNRLTEPQIQQLGGLRVLVADDEPSVRQTIQRLMVRRNAIPVVACDGAAAEELLRSESFDVVLLDVMMPKRTGDELVPIVRTLHPNTPIIVMSGFSDKPRGSEAPDAFIEKPFNIRTLETTIHRTLRTKRLRAKSSQPPANVPMRPSRPGSANDG